MTLRVTVLALVAALLLAACGGDDEPEAQAPAPATTEQETVTGTTEGAEGEGSAAILLAAGRNTLDSGSSRVFVEAEVGGRAFTGEGTYDYDDHVGEMQLDLGDLGAGVGELELVFADNVVYYHLPPGTLPGGKDWIKIDVKALGNSAGVDFAQLAQGNQSDPAQYLRWLWAVGEDVEELGTETVRGVETTHYRATVDLDRVVEAAEAEVRDATRVWIDLLKQQLELGEVPIDVWVDEDGLVRRIEQEYEVGDTQTQIRMELDDFGVEVDSEAPPADEVIDLGDLGGL